MKSRNEKASIDRLMLAVICDTLVSAINSFSKDKKEMPSFIDYVTGREESKNKTEKHCSSYESSEDFENARRKIIGKEVI